MKTLIVDEFQCRKSDCPQVGLEMEQNNGVIMAAKCQTE